jgi:hypothetical protein
MTVIVMQNGFCLGVGTNKKGKVKGETEGSLRQLGYIMRPCLKSNEKEEQKGKEKRRVPEGERERKGEQRKNLQNIF